MRKRFAKKHHLIFVAIFVVSLLGLWVWSFRWPTATLELKGQELHVQVAKLPQHQYKGLGGRETLAPYDGMLFVFPIARHIGIVMRDMQFPLDIVWFDKGVVVDIAPNVQTEPEKQDGELTVYQPRVPAKHVLELPAGWVQEHGLKIGDRLMVVEE